MYKYLLIVLLPFMLFAESEMKCESGKCASGDSSMDNTNFRSKTIQKRATVEQLFP